MGSCHNPGLVVCATVLRKTVSAVWSWAGGGDREKLATKAQSSARELRGAIRPNRVKSITVCQTTISPNDSEHTQKIKID